MKKSIILIVWASLFSLFVNAQDLNKYNTIVIERTPHLDRYEIAEGIGKVFSEKGFNVKLNQKLESIPPSERRCALRCKYYFNPVYGGHSTLEINIYDQFGNEVMNLYGDGYGPTTKSDARIALRKALRPIKEMDYTFSDELKNDSITGPTLTEDSVRIYLKENSIAPIEGIYNAVYGKYSKFAIIRKKESTYALYILESAVPHWTQGSILFVLNKVNSNLYSVTGTRIKGNYDEEVTGTAQNKDGVFTITFDAQNPIHMIKVFPNDISDDQTDSSDTSQELWTGTGFALEGGYIITNHHVTDKAKNIEISGVDGDFTNKYKAKVVGMDKVCDLALLKIEDNDFKGFGTIPYSFKSTMVEVGEDVYVLGYPLIQSMGEEIKLTNGIISARSGYDGNIANYQISVPLQPGNSGGPMFDMHGNLVGVVCAKHTEAENASYAIKASYLKNLVESVADLSILPVKNSMSELQLKDQVKKARNFVFVIRCSK